MHVLTVIDHPNPNSFSHAAANHFMSGAMAAGHSTELADLHQEGFNPLWSQEDIASDGVSNVPLDVLHEQHRIARADAICLVFPLFWWGMPAMMKGWADRVWSWGWAYDQLDDPETSLQRPRSGVLLVPAGASSTEIEQEGHKAALTHLWIDSTFGYFGLSPRRLELLCGATGSAARRDALLQRAHDIGKNLASAPPAHGAETAAKVAHN